MRAATSHGASTSYAWKPHARLKGDAQKIGETLERMKETHGNISNKLVVLEARAKDSVLHGYFDWTDSSAAEKYREVQAAHLLRSIVVVKSAAVPHLSAPTRGFVSIRSVRDEGEDEDLTGTYTTLAEAVRVVDYRQQLMEQALRDLDAYRLKYQLLSDITGWGHSIIMAREALEKVLNAQKELKAA